MSACSGEEQFTTGTMEMDSFFPLSDDLFAHPEPDIQRQEHLELDTAVETVKIHPNDFKYENDSFSDDTQPEHPTVASNESSNHPSPTKPMNFTNSAKKPNLDPQLSSSKTLHPYNANVPQLAAEELARHPVKIESNEVDLADFIDNFLEADEGTNAVSDLHSQIRPEPSDIAPIATGRKPVLSTTALRGQPSSSIVRPSSITKPFVPNHVATNSKGFGNSRRSVGISLLSRGTTTTAATAKKAEKRKPRTYSQAIPSQHCHICSRRPTEGSPHQVCGNLLKGRCRKTICTKCFHQFRWDLKAAREAPPGTWECPHCRGECPQRAQCVIYNRTSDRRRLKLINHRKRKNAPEGSKAQKNGTPAKKQALEKNESPDSGRTVMTSVLSLRTNSEREVTVPGQMSLSQDHKLRRRTSCASTKKELVIEKNKQATESKGMDLITVGEQNIDHGFFDQDVAPEHGGSFQPIHASVSTIGHEVMQPLLLWASENGQHGAQVSNQFRAHKKDEDLQGYDCINPSLELFGSPQALQREDAVKSTDCGTKIVSEIENPRDKEGAFLGQFTVCIGDLVPATNNLQDELIVTEPNTATAENLWGFNMPSMPEADPESTEPSKSPIKQEERLNNFNDINLTEIPANALQADNFESQEEELFRQL